MIRQDILEFLSSKAISLSGDLKKEFDSANTFDFLDSMRFLELLSTLEEKYNRELDLSEFDLEDFQSFGGLCKCLESILKAEND